MSALVERWKDIRKSESSLFSCVTDFIERGLPMQRFEHTASAIFILEALRISKSRAAAADILGIHVNSMNNWCKRLGITDEAIAEIKEVK